MGLRVPIELPANKQILVYIVVVSMKHELEKI